MREQGSQFPKLLVFNDCSDQVNYGSEALMEGLIRIFKAAITDHTLRLIPSHWVMEPDPNWFKAFHDDRSLIQPQAIWPEVADQFDCVADEWRAGRGGPGVDVYLKALHGVVDRGWLGKFIEHRIADRRVVRLIQKWLNAGVLEDGMRRWSELGTPQGGSISPLLANVYLHYVFDLWAHRWRKTHAHGDVIVVRYADDVIVGFQSRADAERFLAELRERFTKFGLELHPEKTRRLEFGPFAAENRQRAGKGKPETFNFLGFTHICGKKRNGRFTVVRQTIRGRLQAKLGEVKAELRRRMHVPIPVVGAWLRTVVGGHLRYYGVPMNRPALITFHFQVGRLWYRTLRRRGQRRRLTWERMRRLIWRWLPPARITHPYPLRRLGVVT